MKLAIADTNESALNDVKKELSKTIGEQNLIAVVCDVSNIEDVRKLRERVFEAWGEVRATINVVPPRPVLADETQHLPIPQCPLTFL